MQQVVLEGNLAKVLDIRVLAEAPIDQIAQHLETRLPTVLPVLPDNTKHIAFDPATKRAVLVVQQAPMRTTIDVHWDMGDRGARPEDYASRDRHGHSFFNLQLPFYFWIYDLKVGDAGFDHAQRLGGAHQLQDFTIDNVRMFMRPTPLTKASDVLWPAKFPNLNNDGSICWGYTQATTASLAERINEQTKTFMATIFNNHLGMKLPQKYPSYTAWEADSDNPFCFLDWPEWQQTTGNYQLKLENLNAGIAAPVQDLTARIDIPFPPPTFTIGRAREWAERLSQRDRRIILPAITEVLTATPEEEDADGGD